MFILLDQVRSNNDDYTSLTFYYTEISTIIEISTPLEISIDSEISKDIKIKTKQKIFVNDYK